MNTFTSSKPKFLKPACDDELDVKGGENLTGDQITSLVFNAHHSKPINVQRELLPIRKYREQILYCLENHQIVILVGETGSGKSTQVPQYLYEMGWHTKGIIGITEPRSVAAVTLANRVAEERGELIGDTCGLVIRFNEQLSDTTKIKYMTEGILIQELLTDPLLTKYSVIIVDEAHERNLLTDIILGLLKKIVKRRDMPKLIIPSATIDASFLNDFFNNSMSQNNQQHQQNIAKNKQKISTALTVEGRMHPVSIFYLKEPCADYVTETVKTVWKIHKNQPPGDILAFLTGQEEVLEALDLLKEYIASEATENIQGFPMYGSLSNSEQLKVFFSLGKGVRKVVIATNIAETSITIPGIVYVIDCGFVKLKWFNAENGIDSLVIAPISKSTAKQRAGRAGRLRAGKVFRLYTEEDYEKLPDQIPPEMRRVELSSTVLHLKALGIENVLRFNFPSAPPAKNLLAALETLYALGALDEYGNLTKEIGYLMAEMPLSPMLSKALYISGQMGCSEEILTIISMLNVNSVFSKPHTAQGQIKARVAKRRFEVVEGDLITLLNVHTAFVENECTKEFCGQNFIIYNNLMRACELREKLSKLANRKFKIPLFSCKGNTELIGKCVTAGFFPNAAFLHSSGVYKKIRSGTELSIHPLSTLYTLQQPQFLIYCDVLQTTKLFMRNLTVIKEEWLTELAPHYYCKKTLRH